MSPVFKSTLNIENVMNDNEGNQLISWYQSLETPGGVYTVILWIGYLNSALNPLLYVLILRVTIKILKV